MFYKADYIILEDKVLENYYMEVKKGKIKSFSRESQKNMKIWER